ACRRRTPGAIRRPRGSPRVRPSGRRLHLHAAAGQGIAMTRIRSRNPAHEATSAHACAIYPFVAESGTWAPGVYIGQDCLGGGGAFCYDPWQLCERQLITGPNLCIVGQLGRGKSALRKSYVLRQLAFGREAVTLDPKGEDAALCQLLDVEPIRLQPGG